MSKKITIYLMGDLEPEKLKRLEKNITLVKIALKSLNKVELPDTNIKDSIKYCKWSINSMEQKIVEMLGEAYMKSLDDKK